jgi:hypothetical protein
VHDGPLAADTLPLASGGCFVVILLVTLARADTLPPLSQLYLVDALPPQLHLLCWYPLCCCILSCRARLVRFVMEGSPYRLSFLFCCNFWFRTTASVVLFCTMGSPVAASCTSFFRPLFPLNEKHFNRCDREKKVYTWRTWTCYIDGKGLESY